MLAPVTDGDQHRHQRQALADFHPDVEADDVGDEAVLRKGELLQLGREAKIGFQVPSSWVSRVGFSSANIAVVGRNLALWADIPHIDPETAFSAGNVQGIEFGQFPTARSIGFTVTVRP